MGANIKLHEYIGKPVMIHEPDAYASDAIAATGCDEGVPIAGFSNVLFILQVGDYTSSDGGGTLQIQYSSAGAAATAATSEAGWTCTDATFTFDSDDTVNEVYMADFSISAKGLSDAAGKLYATWLGNDAACDFALLAIPYGGTRLLPSTNENTVQEWVSVS